MYGTGYRTSLPARRFGAAAGVWQALHRDELVLTARSCGCRTRSATPRFCRSFWQAAAFGIWLPRKFSGAITKATRFIITSIGRAWTAARSLSFLPTNYTYRTDPRNYAAFGKRVQKAASGRFPDPLRLRRSGGGGPCRDPLSMPLRERDLKDAQGRDVFPRWNFEAPAGQGRPQNTWDGELYFNAHRGTYTTQASVKKNNRLSERALHHGICGVHWRHGHGHMMPNRRGGYGKRCCSTSFTTFCRGLPLPGYIMKEPGA